MLAPNPPALSAHSSSSFSRACAYTVQVRWRKGITQSRRCDVLIWRIAAEKTRRGSDQCTQLLSSRPEERKDAGSYWENIYEVTTKESRRCFNLGRTDDYRSGRRKEQMVGRRFAPAAKEEN